VQAQNHTGTYEGATRANVRLALWTLAWVATLALARFGPSSLWDYRPVASWAAVALNVAVGIGWIVAHARYLRGIDELQRKIMQDALAITLGVGWVGGFAYVVADAADIIAREVDVAFFPVLLGLVYMIAIAVGHIRYR
jgi:hypothetical protein